jgi:hypothetical protein
MSKQIKWKFKGTEIYFVTEESRMTRDVMRQRERLQLKQTTKIEIINEFFTTEPNSTGCSSCNGNTPSPELTTLYLDPEEAQAELTASNVRDMLGLLDELSGTPADSEDGLDDSDTGGVNDRLAL